MGKSELTADEVRGVLALQGTAAEPLVSGAIVLAHGEPLRVVWANAAAVALFGTADPDGLQAQLFSGHRREGLAVALQALLPGGRAHYERLRLFRGFRSRTVTASLRRSLLGDGREIVVVAVSALPTAEGDEGAFDVDALLHPTPTMHAAPLFDAENGPVAVQKTRAIAPVGATGLRRFLWRTDATHRLIGSIEGAEGLAMPAAPEGHLPEALRALGVESEELTAALKAEASFSGLRLEWPLVSQAGLIPVAMGGVPMRDENDAFLGYRGYGVADFRAPARQRPAQPALPEPTLEPSEPPEAPEPPAAAEAEPVVPPPVASATPPLPEPVAAEPQAAIPAMVVPAPRPTSTGVRASFSSAKVVALRPHKVSGPSAEPKGNRRQAPITHLSPDEQFNLDEIARALKGADIVDTPRREAPDNSAAVLAALPVPLLVECKGRIVYANTAFLELTGYESARAVDRAGGRPHLLGGVEAAQVAGVAEDKAFPIIHASGSVLSVEGRVAVIEWGGAPAEMLTLRATSDMAAESHAMQAEATRRKTEAGEARSLLDQVSDAAVIVDAQGRLMMVNETTERLFGRDRGSLVGESVGALLTPEGQNAVLGAIFAAASAGQDGQGTQLSLTGRGRDGALLPLRATLRAFDAGRIGIVLRDESAADSLHEELARLRAEVDQHAGTRSEFLAKVSHEVRTPLSAIIGFAEVMLDERFGPLGNPRYKDYLGDILASGRRVIALVADLSSLSAMQAGQHVAALAATDVNRIITDLVTELQEDAHRDRVILRLSLSPRLPSALVEADALRQVMSNLLSNAIRFNEPGGQVILSTTLLEDGGIAVRVRDTGIGMTEAELAVAMEPFRQISTGRPGGGAGLGLPLAKALVEANDATLSIHSRKGEGTLIEVVLRQASGQPVTVPAA